MDRAAPCRPRPLEAAGGRGRSRFPRSLDRARSAAELGARRGAPDRSWAGGGVRGGLSAEGVAEGPYGAEAAIWPRLPRAVPAFPRRRPLRDSICQRSLLLSPPSSARPGSVGYGRGRRGTRRAEPISCQASGEAARGRPETHKERGERRRRRRQRKGAANSGRQLPAVTAGAAAAAGAGSEAAETMQRGSRCGRPRSLGPTRRSLGSPRPLRPPRSPPGRGAPPRSRGRGRKSVRRRRRTRQLASREKFAAPPRGGAARPAPDVRGHRL